MATDTPLKRLATHLLGQPLVPWLRARRPETAWRQIAAELREVTNGEVDVPAQTLINWVGEADRTECDDAEVRS